MIFAIILMKVEKMMKMTIKERFLDYWHTDLAYEDYKYNLSIFEQILYGFIGTIGGFVVIVGIVTTFLIWAIPYVIYKKWAISE